MSFSRCLPCSGLLLAALSTVGCSLQPQQATTDQLVNEMNRRIETISLNSVRDGRIPRFNQAKSLGCFEADFRVRDNLPLDLRQGLFSRPGSYRAQLRFANASTWDDTEKDLRGLSIKVHGIEGEPLWGEVGVQDFLLNSYPALFVATPEEFLDFIEARQNDSRLGFFLNPFDSHLKSLWILIKARKVHLSPFDIRYWSTTPFKHGADSDVAVKYSVSPCSKYHTDTPVEPGPDQLRSAMKAHLERESVCLEFGVQKRVGSMPLEDASVIWDEDDSPFQTVATLSIAPQIFDTPKALAACEALSFNPWQSLPEHAPLGRMNAVRRDVYIRAEKLRAQQRSTPLSEAKREVQ